MKLIKGIVFDVDGVLINTENIHYESFKNVLQSQGYELDLPNYMKWFSGRSIAGGVAAFNTDNAEQLDVEVIKSQKIAATVNAFRKSLVFYEDTLSFIQKVAGQTTELPKLDLILDRPIIGLATGLDRVLVEAMFENKPELSQLFQVKIVAEDYTNSKPDPEPYLKAVTAMSLNVDQVVGVEDSPPGVMALKSAGIYSIALRNTHDDAQLGEANILVNSLQELLVI
jgi:beta-phosphoglucomutase-like phosphatase (HAD superfamily)